MDKRHEDLSIFCADIGSVAKGRFGWAHKIPNGDLTAGTDIRDFANAIVAALSLKRRVALGFEAPMFIPARQDPLLLTLARGGEGNRPWSAGAGTGALVTGIVETHWVFDQVKQALGSTTPRPVFEWSQFLSSQTLFLWEAFVTHRAKGRSHHDDATIAVMCFERGLPEPETVNAIREPSVISLLGLSLLRAGWSTDVAILKAPCLVVRAEASPKYAT